LAALCERRLGVPHISTGEIFRQEIARSSALGRRVQRFVTSGRLVPDALVVAVMASRLRAQVLAAGFALDGFPRTRGQAVGLDRVLSHRQASLDGAVYLEAPQSVLVRRLSGRRVCPHCGANYHVRTMRPRRSGRCDRCGTALVIRKDDQPATIRKRLAVDRAAAAPLVRYYERRGGLYRVNGAGIVGRVFARLERLFREQGWLPPPVCLPKAGRSVRQSDVGLPRAARRQVVG
jgi:adenylate kinase